MDTPPASWHSFTSYTLRDPCPLRLYVSAAPPEFPPPLCPRLCLVSALPSHFLPSNASAFSTSAPCTVPHPYCPCTVPEPSIVCHSVSTAPPAGVSPKGDALSPAQLIKQHRQQMSANDHPSALCSPPHRLPSMGVELVLRHCAH